jgi:long-subunit acyl-CoA synthetase (AMP-forming)
VGLGQWAPRPWGIGKQVNRGNVKKLLTLTTIAIAMAALALMSACQTVATNDAELAASRKEFLLAQSGFKVITVTTPKQQQAINGLAQYRVSAVKYNGKLYYVFPTATKDKIYVGKQKQFNAYKTALAAQQTSQPASQQAQPGQQLINPAPTMTYETAGPQHIEVDQFDGFGPMGTASLGDW